MLLDVEHAFLADDVTILCCQAVASTSCLANFETVKELVQLVGKRRVGVELCKAQLC